MINLIPPEEIRSVRLEYWSRVGVVFGVVLSIVLLVGIVVLLPSYAMVKAQIDSYQELTLSAHAKISDQESMSRDLERAVEQADMILEEENLPLISGYISTVLNVEGGDIKINNLEITRQDKGDQKLQIGGVAKDRQSLAGFRDLLQKEPTITTVDLPISDLVGDQDVSFDIMVTFKTNQEAYE